MNRTISRGLRTLAQLVAAGGLTALINAMAEGLTPNIKAIVLAASTVGVTLCQNLLEAAGKVPTVFEPPHALVPPPRS